jgi:hypothetical protein
VIVCVCDVCVFVCDMYVCVCVCVTLDVPVMYVCADVGIVNGFDDEIHPELDQVCDVCYMCK